MVKTRIFLLMLLLPWTVAGNGQTDTAKTADKSQFNLYANFGIQLPEYGKLNTLLADDGLATLNKVNFAAGGGFYSFYPKSNIATMTSVFVYEQTSTVRESITEIHGTGVGAAFGYALINKSKIQLLPYAGTVFAWLNLNMLSTIQNNTTWNAYLTGSANQYEITGSNWLSDIGIQGATTMTIDKKTGQKLLLGIKTGYYTPLIQTIWTTYETELSGGPKINAGGFYAGFIIGMIK